MVHRGGKLRQKQLRNTLGNCTIPFITKLKNLWGIKFPYNINICTYKKKHQYGVALVTNEHVLCMMNLITLDEVNIPGQVYIICSLFKSTQP